MSKFVELGATAVDQLNLSPDVKTALKAVQAELAEAYRESFMQMVEAINKQASAIDRIQHTLELLTKHLHMQPSLAAQLPAIMRVASDGEQPDLASALIVADPIGAGFTLSIATLSQVLGLPAGDVSVLLKAFKINEDENCAVVIRRGSKYNTLINYHPRTVERFRAMLAEPPAGLSPSQRKICDRLVRRSLAAPSPLEADSVSAEQPKKQQAAPRAQRK